MTSLFEMPGIGKKFTKKLSLAEISSLDELYNEPKLELLEVCNIRYMIQNAKIRKNPNTGLE